MVWEEKYSYQIPVPGLRVTSKKPGITDKSIFLPAGGFSSGSNTVETKYEPHCRYWSATPEKTSGEAWHVNISENDGVSVISTAKYFGMSLRAVCP